MKFLMSVMNVLPILIWACLYCILFHCNDRHLRKELKYYFKHTPCKVALVLDELSLEVLRQYSSKKDVGNIEYTQFYSLSKPVKPLSNQDNETIDNSILSADSYASISTLDGSNMTKKSSISAFTPNSNDHSFSSQDESSQNTTPEKSGYKDF